MPPTINTAPGTRSPLARSPRTARSGDVGDSPRSPFSTSTRSPLAHHVSPAAFGSKLERSSSFRSIGARLHRAATEAPPRRGSMTQTRTAAGLMPTARSPRSSSISAAAAASAAERQQHARALGPTPEGSVVGGDSAASDTGTDVPSQQEQKEAGEEEELSGSVQQPEVRGVPSVAGSRRSSLFSPTNSTTTNDTPTSVASKFATVVATASKAKRALRAMRRRAHLRQLFTGRGRQQRHGRRRSSLDTDSKSAVEGPETRGGPEGDHKTDSDDDVDEGDDDDDAASSGGWNPAAAGRALGPAKGSGEIRAAKGVQPQARGQHGKAAKSDKKEGSASATASAGNAARPRVNKLKKRGASYVSLVSSIAAAEHGHHVRQRLKNSKLALRASIRASTQRMASMTHTHYDPLHGSTHTEQRARERAYKKRLWSHKVCVWVCVKSREIVR